MKSPSGGSTNPPESPFFCNAEATPKDGQCLSEFGDRTDFQQMLSSVSCGYVVVPSSATNRHLASNENGPQRTRLS